MDHAELRALELFDGLDDDQLQELLDASTEVRMRRAQVLFSEGHPADAWWMLLDGTMALVRKVGTEESVLGYMTVPGQWAGGFAAWDPSGTYIASARAENPGRVLRLDSAELRRLSQKWFPFGLHFIDGMVTTVRRMESSARQRDALVALGTLSAGLAHELNNPASAATRAVDALQGTSELVLAVGEVHPRERRLGAAHPAAQRVECGELLRRDASGREGGERGQDQLRRPLQRVDRPGGGGCRVVELVGEAR